MGRRGGGGHLATLIWVAMQRRMFILFMFDFSKTASFNGPDMFCNTECLYIYIYIFELCNVFGFGQVCKAHRECPSTFFFFLIKMNRYIKIISWNIKGCGNPVKRRKVLTFKI